MILVHKIEILSSKMQLTIALQIGLILSICKFISEFIFYVYVLLGFYMELILMVPLSLLS